MRIPPSVAKEIGAMYAAAHANEHVADNLSGSSKLLAAAADSANASDTTAALRDANAAVDLLANAVAVDETTVAPASMRAAAQALASASAAIDLLGLGRLNDAAQALLRGSRSADAGVGAATDLAGSYRAQADQLANEYMSGPAA